MSAFSDSAVYALIPVKTVFEQRTGKEDADGEATDWDDPKFLDAVAANMTKRANDGNTYTASDVAYYVFTEEEETRVEDGDDWGLTWTGDAITALDFTVADSGAKRILEAARSGGKTIDSDGFYTLRNSPGSAKSVRGTITAYKLVDGEKGAVATGYNGYKKIPCAIGGDSRERCIRINFVDGVSEEFEIPWEAELADQGYTEIPLANFNDKLDRYKTGDAVMRIRYITSVVTPN